MPYWTMWGKWKYAFTETRKSMNVFGENRL